MNKPQHCSYWVSIGVTVLWVAMNALIFQGPCFSRLQLMLRARVGCFVHLRSRLFIQKTISTVTDIRWAYLFNISRHPRELMSSFSGHHQLCPWKSNKGSYRSMWKNYITMHSQAPHFKAHLGEEDGNGGTVPQAARVFIARHSPYSFYRACRSEKEREKPHNQNLLPKIWLYRLTWQWLPPNICINLCSGHLSLPDKKRSEA